MNGVTEIANPQLSAWQNYYVIIGSAGASLIGIQFVVIALVVNLRRRTTLDQLSAFATPTVTHLGGALIISAIMSAPWPSLFPASVVLAMFGLAGLCYGAIVIRRTRRPTAGYKPVWEDWLWHGILPCCIYAALAIAALLLRRTAQFAIFVIAAATLGLLLIGIHNAWDTVTYMIATSFHDDSTKKE